MNEFELIELLDKCEDPDELDSIVLTYTTANGVHHIDTQIFDALSYKRESMKPAKRVLSRESYDEIINSSVVPDNVDLTASRVDITKKPINLRKKKSDPEILRKCNFSVKLDCGNIELEKTLSDMCIGYETSCDRIILFFKVNSDNIKLPLHNIIRSVRISHLTSNELEVFSIFRKIKFSPPTLLMGANRCDDDFIDEIAIAFDTQL